LNGNAAFVNSRRTRQFQFLFEESHRHGSSQFPIRRLYSQVIASRYGKFPDGDFEGTRETP
jgi:hypothetical protein